MTRRSLNRPAFKHIHADAVTLISASGCDKKILGRG
jgi:hypothetical protein